MIPPWPIPVTAVSPVSCGSVLWRTGQRRLATIVVKATFNLVHERTATLASPLTILREDGDGGPSDLAPYVPSVGVMLKGHAAAPGGEPTQAMSVRLAIYRDPREPRLLDKTLHVFGDRTPLPAMFTRMPIVWERALGGPGFAKNPVGMASFPNIVDPLNEGKPASFAPIPRAFPSRRKRLGTTSPEAICAAVPDIPDGFDWRYFQAAPGDQQLRPLRGDEWIVLDGFHPRLPRIQSQLPSAKARARVRVGREAHRFVDLVADTILIDADRGIFVMVFRDHVVLDGDGALPDIEVHAGLALPDRPIDWPVTMGETPKAAVTMGETPKPAVTMGETPKPPDLGSTATTVTSPFAKDPLPFKPAPSSAALPTPALSPPVRTGTLEIDLRKMPKHAVPFEVVAASSPAPVQHASSPAIDVVTMGETPKPPAQAVMMGETPKPPAQAVMMGETPKPPAQPVTASMPVVDSPPPAPIPPPALGWAMPSSAPEGVLPSRPSRPPPSPPRDEGLRRIIRARLSAHESLGDLPLAGADLSDLDLHSAILSGCDLRGANLARATLDDASLAGADLRHANLAQAILVAADLSLANLSGAWLEGARFDSALLAGVDMSSAHGAGASFKGASGPRARFGHGTWDHAVFDDFHAEALDFAGASLTGASFRGASIADVRLQGARGKAIFDGATMPRAHARGALLARASFEGADLAGSEWEGANVEHASFQGAKLASSVFRRARCADASFEGADLRSADMEEVSGERANFTGASLEGANLRRACLSEASLERAKASDVLAFKADLSGARMAFADLTRCNLRSSILRGATLTRAKLDGADLRGADLTRADLERASMEGAKTSAQGTRSTSTT